MRDSSAKQALAILEGLIGRTNSGDLIWSPWESGEEEYTAETTKFRFYIKPDLFDENEYAFQVWRRSTEAGKAALVLEVETSDSSVLADSLEALYSAASDAASATSKLASEILEDLN